MNAMGRLRPLRWILLLSGTLNMFAQPTLASVWAKHDALVLGLKGPSLTPDPNRAHFFTGKSGRRVRAWDLGLEAAPVILTWGGGPGDTLSPERLSMGFSSPNAYRHIVLDQPGTGGSDWVPGWKPEDCVDDAVTFLRQRNIRGPILVSGYSWGSTMALLFAQRHPQWVRGLVIGGVWTNTPEEVAYYLDAQGPRSWMPGLSEAFRAYSDGRGTACDLHHAIRQGRGGAALAKAYVDAELMQCDVGGIPRPVLLEPQTGPDRGPVGMATEKDEDTRFAFIESEMLCRGQRGAWKLHLRFPKALASVPLVVIQGRYDQVCMPETARRVFRAWPGHRKRLIPMNAGHWSFSGPSPNSRKRAGLELTPTQEQQLDRAMKLDFGSGFIIEAALACLIEEQGVPRKENH